MYLQFKEPVVPETFNRTEVREGLVIEGTKPEADVSTLTFANVMNNSNDKNNAFVSDNSKENSGTKKQLMDFCLFSDKEALQLHTSQVPTKLQYCEEGTITNNLL
jgi:hypothetical protein